MLEFPNWKSKVKKEFIQCLGLDNLTRNPELELLRLFSMLLVMFTHILEQTLPVGGSHPLFKLHRLMYASSRVCNAEFILLTVHFWSKRYKSFFKFSKFISLLYTFSSIHLLTLSFSLSLGLQTVTSDEIFLAFFPLGHDQLWYIGSYTVAFLLFSDYINGIHKSGKLKHLLTLIFCSYSGILNSLDRKKQLGFLWYNGTSISLFFLYLYAGSYITFYPIKMNIFLHLIFTLFSIYLVYLGINHHFNKGNVYFEKLAKTLNSNDYQSPLFMLYALLLFTLFQRIKINKYIGKIINYLSKYTLAIYIFDNSPFTVKWFLRRREVPKTKIKFIKEMIKIIIPMITIPIKYEFLRQFFSNLLIFNRSYYKYLANKVDSYFEKFSNPEQELPQDLCFIQDINKDDKVKFDQIDDNFQNEDEYYSQSYDSSYNDN